MEPWYNKYIRAKFAIKGRGPDVFDCWGLLQWVYAHDHPDKIILPGYEELYKTTYDKEHLANLIFEQRQAKWQPVTTPQPWDAILLDFEGFAMHVGIVTEPGWMLHCGHGINTSHEKYPSIRWPDSKIQGFFRYVP